MSPRNDKRRYGIIHGMKEVLQRRCVCRRACARASSCIVSCYSAIVARFEYDAWGNILSATSSVPALAVNRYRFQCREWSSATGLVNFRARWYDPVTGRWLSKDPIGLNGGLNLYAFCGNDPINYCDFEGLECDKKPGMFLPPDMA